MSVGIDNKSNAICTAQAAGGEKTNDRISALSAEINELAMQMQNVEMSREYYFNKLVLIEN